MAGLVQPALLDYKQEHTICNHYYFFNLYNIQYIISYFIAKFLLLLVIVVGSSCWIIIGIKNLGGARDVRYNEMSAGRTKRVNHF